MIEKFRTDIVKKIEEWGLKETESSLERHNEVITLANETVVVDVHIKMLPRLR